MSKNKTLDFTPNYANIIEIDVDPNGDKPEWAYALEGIEECTPDSEEATEEMDTYEMLGGTEKVVTKVKPSLTMSGKRKYGSKAQDFIQSRALKTSTDRKTKYRWTQPDGTRLTGICTLTDLKPGSGMGKSSDNSAFSYKMDMNTWEEDITNRSSIMPEAVTAKDVTVKVGATANAETTITPDNTNPYCHYFIEDDEIATVNSDGVVTGVAEGETTMTIKCAAKPSIVTQVKVTVTAAAVAASTK